MYLSIYQYIHPFNQVGSLSNKLEDHSEDSRELQQHIDAALNEKTVQQIESRMINTKRKETLLKRT